MSRDTKEQRTGPPPEQTQARRFGKSRLAQSRALLEDKRDGLAMGRPYRGVFLTETGQTLAERLRARLRLVVNLLVALAVPTEVAEADAEGIEHYVSEATLKAFACFLQSPGFGRAPRKASRQSGTPPRQAVG
jgi:DtxR family manganese transport transcriptional regulator